MPARDYVAWAKYDAQEPICATRVLEKLIGAQTYITAIGAGVKMNSRNPNPYDFLPWTEEQPEPIESIREKLIRMGFSKDEHATSDSGT